MPILRAWSLLLTVGLLTACSTHPPRPAPPKPPATRICTTDAPPAGAKTLGETQLLFKLCPQVEDISHTPALDKPLYNGLWYKKRQAPASHYQNMPDGSLGIAAGGDLATARPDGRPGVLPLLSGDKAFYVEFQAAITDHHPDHWPALWLLPIEHNMRQEDHLPGDPPKFERWMEIDVDEGGFGPGHHGALINWSGIWPDYKMRQNQHNMTSRQPLDRTQAHVFGVSYEPDKRQVTWWIDGVAQMSAGGELIPPIARNHHYYLIMSSQTRKEGRPYLMHFYGLRVFTRP